MPIFLAGTLNFLFNFWMVSVMLIVLFLLGLDFSVFLMESLILAQDERWRRA